jgi:hypothetical protein
MSRFFSGKVGMMSPQRKPDRTSLDRDIAVPGETLQQPQPKTNLDSAKKDEAEADESQKLDEAVKTFYLDVSAGNRPNTHQAPDASPQPDSRTTSQSLRKTASTSDLPAISTGIVQHPTRPTSDRPLAAVSQKPNGSQNPPATMDLKSGPRFPVSGPLPIPPATKKQKLAAKKQGPTRSSQHLKPLVALKSRIDLAPAASSRFKALRHSLGNISSLGVSFLLHLALLLLLSFYTLATLRSEPDLELLAGTIPSEEVVDFSEIEIDPTENLAELNDELDPNQIDIDDITPGQSAFSELSAESTFANVADGPGLVTDSPGDVGELFGEDGQGLADLGLGMGKSSASFFGSQTKARRIIYLIDNTSSMRKGGLETVVSELLKSVDALGKNQRFYILFFSDQVYPLFFPLSSPDYLRSTKDNRQKLRHWLDTVEYCTGGVWQLIQGLEIAGKMRPDVIFLLSDGNRWNAVRADYKVQGVQQLLTTANAYRIPIHTLGMGCQGDADRKNLEAVAKVNSGTFREVRIHPDMVELAIRKKRPYHNEGPGKIWGSKVPKKRRK